MNLSLPIEAQNRFSSAIKFPDTQKRRQRDESTALVPWRAVHGCRDPAVSVAIGDGRNRAPSLDCGKLTDINGNAVALLADFAQGAGWLASPRQPFGLA